MVADEGARRMPARWNLAANLASLARRSFGPAAAMHVLARIRGSKLGLRTHLVLFGLAIVVPVQIYSAVLLHRYSQSEREQSEQRVLQIARALNADIDREISAIITTLETLATADALALKDFKSFHLQAKEALKSRPWNVLVIDASAPPARQYAAAAGHAAAGQRGSRARPGAHRAGDRPALRHRPLHGHRGQALDLLRQRSRATAQGHRVCAGHVAGAGAAGRDPEGGEPAAGLVRGGVGPEEHQHGAHAHGRAVPGPAGAGSLAQPLRRQPRGRHHDRRFGG